MSKMVDTEVTFACSISYYKTVTIPLPEDIKLQALNEDEIDALRKEHEVTIGRPDWMSVENWRAF